MGAGSLWLTGCAAAPAGHRPGSSPFRARSNAAVLPPFRLPARSRLRPRERAPVPARHVPQAPALAVRQPFRAGPQAARAGAGGNRRNRRPRWRLPAPRSGRVRRRSIRPDHPRGRAGGVHRDVRDGGAAARRRAPGRRGPAGLFVGSSSSDSPSSATTPGAATGLDATRGSSLSSRGAPPSRGSPGRPRRRRRRLRLWPSPSASPAPPPAPASSPAGSRSSLSPSVSSVSISDSASMSSGSSSS